MSKTSPHRLVRLLISTAILFLANAAYFGVQIRLRSEVPKETKAAQAPQSDAQNLEKLLETDAQGLSRLTAVIQTARGRMKLRFYSLDAPQTVRREIELMKSGFYDGLTFHRVVPGFIIQGGDPTGTGRGGSGVVQRAEFNQRPHVPGAVAMARAEEDIHSADSQFYISLGTHPTLDQNYTVFGQLIEGIEVANQIQVGDRITAIQFEVGN